MQNILTYLVIDDGYFDHLIKIVSTITIKLLIIYLGLTCILWGGTLKLCKYLYFIKLPIFPLFMRA